VNAKKKASSQEEGDAHPLYPPPRCAPGEVDTRGVVIQRKFPVRREPESGFQLGEVSS